MTMPKGNLTGRVVVAALALGMALPAFASRLNRIGPTRAAARAESSAARSSSSTSRNSGHKSISWPPENSRSRSIMTIAELEWTPDSK